MSPAAIRVFALLLAAGGLSLTFFADKKAKKTKKATETKPPIPKLKPPAKKVEQEEPPAPEPEKEPEGETEQEPQE